MPEAMSTAPSAPAHSPAVLGVAGLCAVLEAAFTLLETPLFGLGEVRRQAILHGAFWPGLLAGWEPIFPGQKLTMFFSYAVLHAGLMHMIFNMLILLHLGRETVERLGHWGFLLLFAVSSAGGGAAFWLLSDAAGPMLGASGAVFGLFGATMFWDWQRRRVRGEPVQPVLRMGLGLVAMNVILWVMVGGFLAWEAHLGGFLAGLALARLATPTPAHHAGRRHGGFR